MIVDAVVVVILLFSALVSLWRGFIREVLTIVGVVGGIVAAYAGGPLLIPYMRGWMGVVDGKEPEKLFGHIPYDMVADAASYVTVLIVVVFVLSVISHFISEFVKNIGLGPLDRTLGVVFGLARGVLLVGILYLPLFYLVQDPAKKKEYFGDSHSVVYLDAVSGWIASYLPGEVEQAIGDSAKKLEDGNAARQKLQDMKLLGEDQNKNAQDDGAQQGTDSGSDAKDNKDNEDNKDGYNDSFREDMNRLIQDSLSPAQQNTNE